MSLLDLPEIVSKDSSPEQSSESPITINKILELLPGKVYQRISKTPASISQKLRANGIYPVSKDKVIRYSASQKQEIIDILSQVPSAVPDSIEKAGSLEAYKAILEARKQ